MLSELQDVTRRDHFNRCDHWFTRMRESVEILRGMAVTGAEPLTTAREYPLIRSSGWKTRVYDNHFGTIH